MRSAAAKLLASSLLLLMPACVVGDDIPDMEFGSSEGYQPVERFDLFPGDEVEGALGAIAEVPEPGMSVHTEMMFDDGSTDTLIIETDFDGNVWQLIDTADSLELAAGSPGACQDRAYNNLPYKWRETYRWWFQAGSTPGNLGRTATETRLRRATGNITFSRNNCGMDDSVSASHSYRGRTSRGTNIGARGVCRSSDGYNVTNFGGLPTGVLGVACTWYTSERTALESDMRLNNEYRWYNNRPSGCSNRFGVEAVATHERGHTFGLGHVSESTHGNLTMSTAIAPCSNKEESLGRGDVRALRAKY